MNPAAAVSGILLIFLSAQASFASSGSPYPVTIDPSAECAGLPLLIIPAVIIAAILILGLRDLAKTGRWPAENGAAIAVICFYLLNCLRTFVEKHPDAPTSYQLMAAPMIPGLVLGSILNHARNMMKRELRPFDVIWMLILSFLLVIVGKDEWNLVRSHGSGVRYATAAATVIIAILFERFDHLRENSRKSHEDGKDSEEARSDEFSSEGRGTSPMV